MKVKCAERKFWQLLALVPLMVIALLLAGRDVGRAHAANPQPIHVNTTVDLLTSSNGSCSLREAIEAANQNVSVDGCPAGSPPPNVDTIYVPSGTYVLTISGADEDFNTSGDLDVTQNDLLVPSSVDIVGDGEATTIISEAAGVDDRILDVRPGNTATISGLTIERGV